MTATVLPLIVRSGTSRQIETVCRLCARTLYAEPDVTDRVHPCCALYWTAAKDCPSCLESQYAATDRANRAKARPRRRT